MKNVDIVLLSGGSGKRLWPLSNGVHSKQFLKLLKSPDGLPESMIQRVMRQITQARLGSSVIVSTIYSQVDSIYSQLGSSVDVVLEPSLRDTFPAISLASTYLLKKKNRTEEDIVVIMPSDPYTQAGYFKTIARMIEAVENDVADLLLMGIKPNQPSSKFGYIVPSTNNEGVKKVSKFVENPDLKLAEELISSGAMFNGGVFVFKLGFIKKYIEKYLEQKSFEYVYDNYVSLPKISFDYEVAENADSVAVIDFDGQWEDLGTWDMLSKHIDETMGNVYIDNSSEESTVVNELYIPIVALGLKDVIVAASHDGILVADKSLSSNLKKHIEHVAFSRPMYEERRWGSYKALEQKTFATGQKMLVKSLKIEDGKHISYQRHLKRDEIWTVVNGRGIVVVDGDVKEISVGDVVKVKAGDLHTLKGVENLEIVEVQLGESLEEYDIERFDYQW